MPHFLTIPRELRDEILRRVTTDYYAYDVPLYRTSRIRPGFRTYTPDNEVVHMLATRHRPRWQLDPPIAFVNKQLRAETHNVLVCHKGNAWRAHVAVITHAPRDPDGNADVVENYTLSRWARLQSPRARHIDGLCLTLYFGRKGVLPIPHNRSGLDPRQYFGAVSALNFADNVVKRANFPRLGAMMPNLRIRMLNIHLSLIYMDECSPSIQFLYGWVRSVLGDICARFIHPQDYLADFEQDRRAVVPVNVEGNFLWIRKGEGSMVYKQAEAMRQNIDGVCVTIESTADICRSVLVLEASQDRERRWSATDQRAYRKPNRHYHEVYGNDPLEDDIDEVLRDHLDVRMDGDFKDMPKATVIPEWVEWDV